jgi:hypothetical protein
VLHLSIPSDGGQTYQELRRQEYTFSPPGTTFEREEWEVGVEGVTHLQLVITPDTGGTPCRATLPSLAIICRHGYDVLDAGEARSRLTQP